MLNNTCSSVTSTCSSLGVEWLRHMNLSLLRRRFLVPEEFGLERLVKRFMGIISSLIWQLRAEVSIVIFYS